MKESFKEKQKRFRETPIELNKKFSPFNVIFLLATVVLFLTTIIGGYNFMTLVLVVFSAFVALFMFLQIVFKNKLNIFMLASYGIMICGTVFTYIVRGADGFWFRLGYNIGLASLAIIGLTVLALIPKFKNQKASFYVTRCTSFVMIGASLIYFLFMSIRMTPTVESMQEGHDAYLKKIRNGAQVGQNDPNVLVILMDDMAYSDISSYSYMGESDATIKTPNIDRIGKMGVMMENCYSSSPVSSPSRFGVLTGRYSARGYLDNVIFPTKQQVAPFGDTRFFNAFEFRNNVDGILGDEITVAEAMQAKGYDTALIGKWNLGDYGQYLPTNQGFDYFFGSHYVNDMTPYNIVREEKGVATEVYSHNEMKDQSLSTERFTNELNTFINKSLEKDGKFFAEYWSPWPHFPIFSNNGGNGEGDKTDDSYIDCIEEFDRAVGTILENLEQKGVLDDTMIIFTSDNGPGREGVTGALRGRKNTPFEGAFKVPFLVSYPNGGVGNNIEPDENGNKVISARCMNMDVFTTILDYANIELPTDRVIDGVSMRGLWEGTTAEDATMHDAIYYLKRGKVQAISMPIEFNGAINDFKYYKDVVTENSAFITQHYKNYLFNLDTDQAEGYNISMKYGDITNKLAKQMEAFKKELKDNRRGILR